jgi:hypothetical protein
VSPPTGWQQASPVAASQPALICSPLRAGTDSAASGQLNSTGKLVMSVSEGSYLVCVSPPVGWRDLDASLVVPPGWICIRARVGPSPLSVTITLTKLPTADGGGR